MNLSDLNSENNLELAYFYCLESKCPMDTTKVRSLAKHATKSIGIWPTKFTQLNYYCSVFFNYVREKNSNINVEDCETYLAWKIWHSKLIDVDRFVFNNLCKSKAHLMASKSLVEFHKSASRIKSAVKSLDALIENTKDDWELFNELNKLHKQLMIQSCTALQVYDNLLINNKEVMHQINNIISQEIKQLGVD